LITANPAVEVSKVIPGITGDNVGLYVEVPSVIVKVSLFERLMAFGIADIPETRSAGLITANAVLESVMNSPAVSESVTVKRYK
jgi:hypothetical protein